MGGGTHVFCFHYKSLGTCLFSSTVKAVGTVAHQWIDLIINIQRSRTPFVFELCLIPVQSILNTDTDESWHTLCVRLPNVCFGLPLQTPRSLHRRGQRRNARSLSVNLSSFLSHVCSLVFFSLDATPKCIYCWRPLAWIGHGPGYDTTIDFWFGFEHPSDAKCSVISPMSLSQYYMFRE